VSINAAQGFPDVAARDMAYQTWTQTVQAMGGAGDQFWLLTSRIDDGSYYPDFDGYRIYWTTNPPIPPTAPHNCSAHTPRRWRRPDRPTAWISVPPRTATKPIARLIRRIA